MEVKDRQQYDVAVIGAGPAGLSAAVRARWVKSYRSVPCSTAIYDPAGPGGLAALRSTMLTGPGFHLTGKELIGRLEQDRTDLNIPLFRDKIDRLQFDGRRWLLYCGESVTATARSVILAVGMRRLSNESRFFNRGLTLTYNGYDFFPQLIRKLIDSAPGNRLLIIGNAKTINLLAVLQDVIRPDTELVFLLDEYQDRKISGLLPGTVYFGTVNRFLGDDNCHGAEAVDRDGKEFRIDCQATFIDYNAFELKPSHSTTVEDLSRDERGFIRIDRNCITNRQGLFAAGDCTGLYAMALKAMSEGAVAGFSAYRYVFEQKFGLSPQLFAYTATDETIDPGLIDYPELRDDDMIEVLLPESAQQTAAALGLAALPGQRFTVGELTSRSTTAQAIVILHALLDEKAVTIQPHKEELRGLAKRI